MFVVFRVDASVRMGSGHVTRCVSLFLALRRGGAQCLFLCREVEGNLLGWLAAQGISALALPAGSTCGDDPYAIDTALDVRSTVDAVGHACGHADWLVVDHYGIDSSWEAGVHSVADRVLAIDDLANRRHFADCIVDQNLQESPDRYTGLLPETCKRLLGVRFAMLRPEFRRQTSRWQQNVGARQNRILACMGGTDPNDILSKVLAAWRLLPAERPILQIAVGNASPNAKTLQSACAKEEGAELHLQTPRMAELMASADLMICACGSISWERCCVGVPAIMGTTAGNQRANLELLTEKRTGLSIGDWNALPAGHLAEQIQRAIARPSLLSRVAARAKKLVDGRGADRVAAHMLSNWLRLRPAQASDASIAWPWRNAEATRRNSFDSRPVSWERHVAWWKNAVADSERSLLIAHIGEMPVGVLRLDHSPANSLVSIYLDPDLTGLGLGTLVLKAGQAWIASNRTNARSLVAEIMDQNTASIAVFEAAGFVRTTGSWHYTIDDIRTLK